MFKCMQLVLLYLSMVFVSLAGFAHLYCLYLSMTFVSLAGFAHLYCLYLSMLFVSLAGFAHLCSLCSKGGAAHRFLHASSPRSSSEPPGALELAIARRWLTLCLRCTGEDWQRPHDSCACSTCSLRLHVCAACHSQCVTLYTAAVPQPRAEQHHRKPPLLALLRSRCGLSEQIACCVGEAAGSAARRCACYSAPCSRSQQVTTTGV
jgi:hypothetical protein